jgi:energy-coupling factor transport system ATP-binding protein
VTALIQINNLYYHPDSLPAEMPDILHNVSLVIDEGAFVAIIGENGSGKTTLVKLINGLLMPTQGNILVDGLDTRHPKNYPRLRSLVGMVFQNPADQIVASTVEEDIAFGLENLNLSSQDIRDRVEEQLLLADLLGEQNRPPHLLSGGQIQKVALAGVLARQPKVILFDEPTSMLDSRTRKDFMARICQLNQAGMTIVYVTHHMEEVVHANLVVAFKSGSISLFGPPAEIFKHNKKLHEIGLDTPEVVQLAEQFRSLGWKIDDEILTPDELVAALPIYDLSRAPQQIQEIKAEKLAGENSITSRNLHYTYLAGTPLEKTALQGVDLDVTSQRVHGIAGANGSGKSTLLQHFNAILRPARGHVHVGEFELENPETNLRDVIKRVGLVFQNPETQFFEVFVGDEIAYGPKQFKMDDIRERVRLAMALVGLDFETFKDRRLETLSSGEKRKVALASTLILDQAILLFDEPTAGMDPRAREELLLLFKKLSDQGKTIVIASHRLEELAFVTDDLSIMQQGKVNLTAPSPKALSDLNSILQSGLVPPLSVLVSQALIMKGWPLAGKDTTRPDRLLHVLRGLA